MPSFVSSLEYLRISSVRGRGKTLMKSTVRPRHIAMTEWSLHGYIRPWHGAARSELIGHGPCKQLYLTISIVYPTLKLVGQREQERHTQHDRLLRPCNYIIRGCATIITFTLDAIQNATPLAITRVDRKADPARTEDTCQKSSIAPTCAPKWAASSGVSSFALRVPSSLPPWKQRQLSLRRRSSSRPSGPSLPTLPTRIRAGAGGAPTMAHTPDG